MFPNAEPSVTQLSDFQTWLSAAKDEEASRNADYAGRSDSDVTLLSHLHSLLTSSEGQVPNDIPHSEPTFLVFFASHDRVFAACSSRQEAGACSRGQSGRKRRRFCGTDGLGITSCGR